LTLTNGKIIDYNEGEEIYDLLPLKNNIRVSREIIFKIGKNFDRLGEYYKATGGVHISALYSISGELLFYFEDISRRNAFDKIIGKTVLENISISNKILMTSGRMSSDIIYKLARSGVLLIASKSAPTDSAIDIAKKLNITMIGFLRGSRFNLYTNSHLLC